MLKTAFRTAVDSVIRFQAARLSNTSRQISSSKIESNSVINGQNLSGIPSVPSSNTTSHPPFHSEANELHSSSQLSQQPLADLTSKSTISEKAAEFSRQRYNSIEDRFAEDAQSFRPSKIPDIFDSLKYVQNLRRAGLEEEPAVAVMRLIQSQIHKFIRREEQYLALKNIVEYNMQLHSSALAELQLESLLSLQEAVDSFEAEISTLRRDIDRLGDEIRTSLWQTKIHLNKISEARKNDTVLEERQRDLQISEMNNKLNVSCSDLRVRIENEKWFLFSMGLAIPLTVLVIFFWTKGGLIFKERRVKQLEKRMEELTGGIHTIEEQGVLAAE